MTDTVPHGIGNSEQLHIFIKFNRLFFVIYERTYKVKNGEVGILNILFYKCLLQ